MPGRRTLLIAGLVVALAAVAGVVSAADPRPEIALTDNARGTVELFASEREGAWNSST